MKHGVGQLKTFVFDRQKFLAQIYQRNKEVTLFDYVNLWPIGKPNIEPKVSHIILALLERVYSPKVSREAMGQLANMPLVSTIDHHGFLSHPFFLNSNLIFSQRKNLKYLVCFGTSGISLNNSSWPAGLVFTNKNGGMQKFSFFPDRQKMQSVFSAPAIKRENTQRVLGQIQESDLEASQKASLVLMLKGVLSKDVYSLKNFSDQASVISNRLWSAFFPSAPQLIYLPIEEITAKILVELINTNRSHILHKLIFTDQGQALLEKYFSGLKGAFGPKGYGSFLFWGVDGKGRRFGFRGENGVLIGEKIRLPLRPLAVARALRSREIYPTSLLCFLVMLYYGITCVGGFNQVNWLTEIKEKFVELLLEIKESILAEKIIKIPTQNFAEGNLAFLNRNQNLIKATGADIFLENNAALYEKYCQLAKELTVGESIESLLPGIYRVVAKLGERDKCLLSISDVDISSTNGVKRKVDRVFSL